MEDHRSLVGRLVGILTATVDEGQQDGSIANGDEAASIACRLWAAMLGALLFSTSSEELLRRYPFPVDTDNFLDHFVDLLSFGLGPEPTP
jgi:hypothetical protein